MSSFFLLMATQPSDEMTPVFWGLALAGAVGTWRYSQMSLKAGAGGIEVRNPIRKYRIDWPDVAAFEAVRPRNVLGTGLAVGVRLTEGGSLVAQATARISEYDVEHDVWELEKMRIRYSSPSEDLPPDSG